MLCRKNDFNELKDILCNTDILFLNKSELRELTKENNLKKGIKKIINCGTKDIAVTLGKEGCLVANETKTIKKEAKKAEVVDTTGAGDAFAAGYLISYIKNESLENRAEKGLDLAKRCVEKIGGSNYGQRP